MRVNFKTCPNCSGLGLKWPFRKCGMCNGFGRVPDTDFTVSAADMPSFTPGDIAVKPGLYIRDFMAAVRASKPEDITIKKRPITYELVAVDKEDQLQLEIEAKELFEKFERFSQSRSAQAAQNSYYRAMMATHETACMLKAQEQAAKQSRAGLGLQIPEALKAYKSVSKPDVYVACSDCKGDGRTPITRFGDTWYVACERCKGTGKINTNEGKEKKMLTKEEYDMGLNTEFKPWFALTQSAREVISNVIFADYLNEDGLWVPKGHNTWSRGRVYRISLATKYAGMETVVERPKGISLVYKEGQARLRFEDNSGLITDVPVDALGRLFGECSARTISRVVDRNKTGACV